MLFAAAAVAASLVASAEGESGRLLAPGTWEVGRHLAFDLLTVYAMRMAAVFTIAASTILLRTGRAPRWLAAGGYSIAVVMLLAIGSVPWVELLFPAWLLVLSTHILIAGLRRGDGNTRDRPGDSPAT